MFKKLLRILTWSMITITCFAWILTIIAFNQKPCGDGMCGVIEFWAASILTLLSLPPIVWAIVAKLKINKFLKLSLSLLSPVILVSILWVLYVGPVTIICMQLGTFYTNNPLSYYSPEDETRRLETPFGLVECNEYSWKIVE